MKTGIRLVVICWVVLLLILPAGASDLRLVPYTSGIFTMKVPEGWDVHIAGQCAELAFAIRDRKNSLCQIFYFGSVGPVYMSAQQKQVDLNYMRMGGHPIAWAEMPVVSPLTPEAFMSQFEQITATQIARQFMPQAPRLQNFQVISSLPRPAAVGGGQGALIRALIAETGGVGEGLFLATVAPFMPAMGGPGGGTAYGFMIAGITAPKREFASLQPSLMESLGSFRVSEAYVRQCMQVSQAAFQQVLRAGQTLRETSDMIVKEWQNRDKAHDIMAEKRSDAILGYERVYNPETKETYQVQPDFWEDYERNRTRFDMGNLQVLPANDHSLWARAPRDQREIR